MTLAQAVEQQTIVCRSGFESHMHSSIFIFERRLMKMEGSKIVGWLGKAEIFTRRKSPVILTGLAIVGVISTAYSAYKAGPRADKILKAYRKDMKDCHPNDKEAKRAVVGETVKKMIPVMAPPIIMSGTTIACVVGSHSVSSRRIAALSAAYTLSESTVKNLNSKMEEILGEKKARAVRDAIMKDKLHETEKKDQKLFGDGNIYVPDNGYVLCKDLYTGRTFYSTAEKIKQAIIKCSSDVQQDMWVSLNDFYMEIGSPQLETVPMGNDLGWNVDDTIRGQLPIYLTALLMEDGKPCLCVDADIQIRDDFRNLH